MSIYVMGMVWNASLPAHLKLVTLAYADKANDDGTSIWPSVEWVAERCGLSERQIQRAKSDLQTMGLLIGDGWHGRTPCYRLDLKRLSVITSADVPNKQKTGDNMSSVAGTDDTHVTGDTHVTPGVTPTSPYTSVNHPAAAAAEKRSDPVTPAAADVRANEARQDPELAAAYRLFENEIGMISGSIAPDMADMFDCLRASGHADWWELAIKQAAGNNKRTWRYVQATLRSCEQQGRPPGIAPPATTRSPTNGRTTKGDALTRVLEKRARERGEIV